MERCRVGATRLLTIVLLLAFLAGCGPNVEALLADGDVDGLIGVLESDAAPPVRADAITALEQLRAGPAVESLLAALQDPDPQVRAAAARALGALGQERAIVPLLIAIDDDVTSVRDAVAAAVGQLVRDVGPVVAADPLVRALEDASPTVRATAADLLGDLGQQAALLPLVTRLGDETGPVRDAAAVALQGLVPDLDPVTASDALVTALAEIGPGARPLVVELLADLGHDGALLPVLLLLEDDDAAVRAAAERELPTLIASLSRRQAATILGQATDHDSTAIRVTAARALGGLGQRIGVPPLLGLHADPDTQVREVAAQSLATLVEGLPAEVAVGALYDGVDDASAPVADAAVAALRSLLVALGPESAVEAMRTVDSSDEWLAVALDVDEAELAARTRQLGIQLEPLDGIRVAAAAAADGGSVPGARAYEEADGFHPAIVLGSAPWSQAEPWAPTALRFLELVVTIDDIDWRVIEVCAYDGPDITRYQGRQTVRVLAAADGRQIAERSFDGTSPRACRQQEPWSLVELFGDDPDVGDAAAWLRSLINPPS